MAQHSSGRYQQVSLPFQLNTWDEWSGQCYAMVWWNRTLIQMPDTQELRICHQQQHTQSIEQSITRLLTNFFHTVSHQVLTLHGSWGKQFIEWHTVPYLHSKTVKYGILDFTNNKVILCFHVQNVLCKFNFLSDLLDAWYSPHLDPEVTQYFGHILNN